MSLEDLFSQIKEGVKELRLIIKADVQGSAEALRQAVEQLSTDEVKVDVIHSGVGAVSESDVMLASASNAVVIGFNVRPDAAGAATAEIEGVDVRLYRVIYDVIDDVKKAMVGLLEPEFREVVTGHAEVRATFKVPKAGMVAGSYVTDGRIARTARVRVLRDGVVVHEEVSWRRSSGSKTTCARWRPGSSAGSASKAGTTCAWATSLRHTAKEEVRRQL